MSLTRPKLQLDEQSFQGLLAAAFTIQEHADLLKQALEISPKVALEPKGAVPRVCGQCAAPLQEDELRCGQCGLEELRPGERMQRKYASLWEMSQDHDVRQERPPEQAEAPLLEVASSGLVVCPEVAGKFPDPSSTEQEIPPKETAWETDPPIEVEQAVHSIPLSISEDDSIPLETNEDSWLTEADKPSVGPWKALFGFRQQLNRHRADLYLGVAILVAFLAVLWPAAVPSQKPRLDPWQRALITLGIAEAPAPQIHYRGDPGIEVWVDPHTALYYCPGEEQFGKTRDGRVTSQRDAQADQFEPANRAACN